jgi:hypothetical protein
MPPTPLSSSDEQQLAEAAARDLLSVVVGCQLVPAVIPILGGSKVNVDGVNRDSRVIAEIYCRVGALKGSQPDKVASDMLKLLLAEKTLGGEWRKVICFVDTSASRCVTGQSWLSAAREGLGIEVQIVSLSPKAIAAIVNAQDRQKMTNVITQQG